MSAPMPSVPSTIGFDRERGPRVADGVVHVRARVVRDRARQVLFEVHGVDEQPRLVCERREPLPRVRVDRPLGDVDVDADAEVAREARGRLERLVAARERGVHTDEPSSTAAEEPLVLVRARAAHRPRRGGRSRRTRTRPALRPRGTRRRSRRASPRSQRATRDGRRSRSFHTRAPRARRASPTTSASRGRARRRASTTPARGSRRTSSASAAAKACRERAPSTGDGARRRDRASRSRRLTRFCVASTDRSDGFRPRLGLVVTRRCRRSTPRRIGSVERHAPSRSCKAAATAPAVGTRPISPTPLMPYGAFGCGDSTRITSTRGMSFGRMMPRLRSVMFVGRPSASAGKSSVSA